MASIRHPPPALTMDVNLECGGLIRHRIHTRHTPLPSPTTSSPAPTPTPTTTAAAAAAAVIPDVGGQWPTLGDVS